MIDDPERIIAGALEEELQLLLYPYIEAERIITRASIKQWISSGYNDDFINRLLGKSLAGKATPAFNTINLIKSELNKFLMRTTDLSYYKGAGYDKDTMCIWITSGANVCPDCILRGGMAAMRFEEWIEIGLPGEGATLCGSACNCVLQEV